MKNQIRFARLLVIAICLLSITVLPAAASNYGNTEITAFSVPNLAYSEPLMPRDKMDTTPIYLWMTELAYDYSSVNVQACGTNAVKQPTVYNCTVSNGALAEYVNCREGVEYSVHSEVYEEGYEYATLRFRAGTAVGAQYIYNGYWSPDSIGTYTSATTAGY